MCNTLILSCGTHILWSEICTDLDSDMHDLWPWYYVSNEMIIAMLAQRTVQITDDWKLFTQSPAWICLL